MILTTDRGAAADLADILAAHDYALVLFKNDRMPDRRDTRADYVEATFPGYAPIVLALADWAISRDDPATAIVPEREWKQTASLEQEERIYGYLIVRADTGALRRVERFPDGPYSMLREFDRIAVTATLSLRSG